MLNKDQYNQEEYNDYYQQEIRGAETSSGGEDESSGGKSGVLILIGLVVLGAAGYFGYTTMNPSNTDSPNDEALVVQTKTEKKEASKPVEEVQALSEPSAKESEQVIEKETQTKVDEPMKTVQAVKTEETTQADKVADGVQTAMGTEQKMSPEEIAKVVQMVMSQMGNKTEKDENSIKESDEISEKDTNLISTLSGTDVDSVKSEDEDKKLEDSLNNIEETTKDTNINKNRAEVDTYNKVKVEENSGDDELSKLSSQISNLISDKKTSDQTNGSKEEKTYTESLKKEVVTRKNEMRIIVVRKGDTLGRIAKRAYGNVMEYKKIYKANPDILKRPDRIYIGQKLRIPK